MSAEDPLTPAELAFRRVMSDRNRTKWREWCALTLRNWRLAHPDVKPDPYTLARGTRKTVTVPDDH